MNWAHLKTFVWLRWRLAVNQIRRSGPGGAIIATILTVLMVAGGAIALVIGFVVGFFALANGSSRAVMVVWDGAVVGFVLFWMMGLMSELQRSDVLSFDRLLHLPVSPTGAFLINYLGSSVGLSLVLFLPAMTGLAAGLVLSRGPGMLLLFPLIAAFFLMATAVTYQFRGWLASMMANPRRRRTIVAVVPFLFILAFQLPNLWNTLGPGAGERRDARAERRRVIATLEEDLAAGRITQEEYDARRPARPGRDSDDSYEVARVVNMVVPLGWLPYGAAAAVDGRVWPPLAGMFGMGLIGAISLGRAYRTTIRLYKGDFDRGRRSARRAIPVVSSAPRRPSARSARFLEWRIPWTSDGASAVAVTGFRSWMRAPEMKMILLTPVILLVVFTGMFAGQSGAAHELMRPLTTSGLAAFLLVIGMAGPVGNQFGFDRAGFRAFVLSPLPRRDVLMGKNLAVLPMALVMMAFGIGLSQWFNPMRADHLVAVLVQTVTMYFVFCLAGNLMSILGPMPLKPGSGMPAGHQGIRGLLPLVFMVVIPLPLGLTLIPLGIEALLSAMGWFAWFPAYLVFGVVQVVGTVWLYRLALDWEGSLLQRREQRILEIVGSRAE
jgi:ABC-2 type transport system permease protein